MEKIIRDFKHHYHKTRKVIPDIDNQGAFTLKINFQVDKLSAKTSTPSPEISIRFAVLMRRFLAPKSDIYYGKILKFLLGKAPKTLTQEKIVKIESYIDSMNRGPVGIKINNNNLSAEEIYSLISEGEYFGNDKKASEYLKELSSMPIVGPLFWHQFFSYTLDGFYLVSGLFDIVRDWEKDHRLKGTEETESTYFSKCIYCLYTDKSFRSEEHIFPEALGNDEALLPSGYVCDECNNGLLSRLDSALIEFEPIAFLQVQFVPYTKAGKFPKANFQNLTIERTHPRHILVTAKDKTGEIYNKKELGDGLISWNMNFRGKPLNSKLLGRSLYKIGLGFVALDQGHDEAMSSRFDLARDFINGASNFPNNMLMSTNVKPRPSLRVTHMTLEPGCPFVIDIFGLIFMFNLEAVPLIEPNDDLLQLGFKKLSLDI